MYNSSNNKQEIERCIDRETVGSPEIPVRIDYEQEECIEEEICDKSLPRMYRAEENVHKDETKLEIPQINAVEISEFPGEVKLEMAIEQSESKLVQDVTLVSDVPTPFHADHEILLPNGTIDLCKTEGEISVPSRHILGKSISKLHTRWRKVLGSRLVKRVNPTRWVKRKIPSMFRPPPRPLDRQNSLNDKASKRVLPDVDQKERSLTKPPDIYYANGEKVNYRPPPKPPYILNINGEVIGIIEKEYLLYAVPKSRPPPKPPRIHCNANREGIRDPEKEHFLDRESNYRPPPKPPPKVCDIARVLWTR